MDYNRIYNNLIQSAKDNPPTGYKECHHIIPKCIGGSNDKDNLVHLSGRQHYMAHQLLARIHGGRLWIAALLMSNRFKTNSRLYETNKRKLSNLRKSSKHTNESKKKISDANKRLRKWRGDSNPSRINHPKGMKNKAHSEQTKEQMSNIKKNRPRPGYEYNWITPLGTFATRKDAAIAHDIAANTVRYRCFSELSKWTHWRAESIL